MGRPYRVNILLDTWTPERIAELTRLWNSGIPSIEIGRIMGLTKNAVLGKRSRLKLRTRVEPNDDVVAPQEPRLRPAPGCQWPYGDPRKPVSFRFCSAPVEAEGAPYCKVCAARAYVRRSA